MIYQLLKKSLKDKNIVYQTNLISIHDVKKFSNVKEINRND